MTFFDIENEMKNKTQISKTKEMNRLFSFPCSSSPCVLDMPHTHSRLLVGGYLRRLRRQWVVDALIAKDAEAKGKEKSKGFFVFFSVFFSNFHYFCTFCIFYVLFVFCAKKKENSKEKVAFIRCDASILGLDGATNSVSDICWRYFKSIAAVCAVGGNKWGEFGVGNTAQSSELTELEWVADITDRDERPMVARVVSCSQCAFAHITGGGEMHFCGANDEGQSGAGAKEERERITKASLVSFYTKNKLKVKSITQSSVAEHMFVTTHCGRIYCNGRNDEGQCAVGTDSKIREPTEVNIAFGAVAKMNVKRLRGRRERVAQISVGWCHSLFLTDVGAVFSCGRNGEGQLGIDTKVRELAKPTQVQLPFTQHENQSFCIFFCVFCFGFEISVKFCIFFLFFCFVTQKAVASLRLLNAVLTLPMQLSSATTRSVL